MSLSVKSALVPNPNGLITTTTPQAVLCTNDQTYQLRQVHTSNSIFVLQTTSGQDTELDNASSTTGKVTAISRCGSTLELIPISSSPKTVLLQSLPLFSDAGNLSAVDSETSKRKEVILNDTPLSSCEFEKSWIELCAFELGGCSWRPSAALLLQIWASLMSAVTLKGLNLEQEFPLSALAPVVEEDGHPLEVLEALLARVCKSKRETYIEVDKHICVCFVGTIMLESQAKAGVQLDTAEFLHHWKDQLPEAWRKEALLEALNWSKVKKMA
ncbi:MAG: hypothetical protein Q9167_007371 [Letrouitia subvulpina]